MCTRTECRFECHHIALRANHESATVHLCGACHDQQTDRQRRAGLIARHSTSADDPALALLHALTEGLAGIVAAQAQRTHNLQLVEHIDRDRRATLRLLASLSDERPSALGPRPINNDRGCRRRQARSTAAPMPSVADSLAALAGIFPALMTAISTPPQPGAATLLPGRAELLRGFTIDDAGRLFSRAGADRVARGLAALEDHPRIKELAVIIDRASTLGFVLCNQLAKATAVDGLGEGQMDTDRLIQLGRAFYNDARSTVDFAVSLATGGDPAEALERFLSRADQSDEHDRSPSP